MPSSIQLPNQQTYLSVLAQAPAEEVKLLADELLVYLPPVEVIQNRTGLAMLPYADSAQGATFHLGEVLVAEAHVRVGTDEGYAACLGRDLVQALGIAILDAIMQSSLASYESLKHRIGAFVAAEAQRQQAADEELLRKVAATCIELEVF